MFDGHRVLADILEDSPYRVFETLRVAQKAVEVGLLRQVESQRPKATWRAVLAIDPRPPVTAFPPTRAAAMASYV